MSIFRTFINQASKQIPEDIPNALFNSPVITDFNPYNDAKLSPFAIKSSICEGYGWSDNEDMISNTVPNLPLFTTFTQNYHQSLLQVIALENNTKHAFEGTGYFLNAFAGFFIPAITFATLINQVLLVFTF